MERERRAQGHVGLRVQRADGDGRVGTARGADRRLHGDKKQFLLLLIIPLLQTPLWRDSTAKLSCPICSSTRSSCTEQPQKEPFPLPGTLLRARSRDMHHSASAHYTRLTPSSQAQTFSEAHSLAYSPRVPAKQRFGRINPSQQAL